MRWKRFNSIEGSFQTTSRSGSNAGLTTDRPAKRPRLNGPRELPAWLRTPLDDTQFSLDPFEKALNAIRDAEPARGSTFGPGHRLAQIGVSFGSSSSTSVDLFRELWAFQIVGAEVGAESADAYWHECAHLTRKYYRSRL